MTALDQADAEIAKTKVGSKEYKKALDKKRELEYNWKGPFTPVPKKKVKNDLS